VRVDQILCAAGPVDAVTGQALAYRRLMAAWGWRGADYAPVQAAGMAPGAVRPLHALAPGRADAVIVHYSGYAPGLEALLPRARRTLLVSHNVTPTHYFWSSDPVEAVRCELARAQLARLTAVADALAGVSEYNAAELRALSARDAEVVPVLFDERALPPAGEAAGGPPAVLFVGRLVPHKRQDLVIRAFARWAAGEPEARLALVGTPLSPAYLEALRRLAGELVPGRVTFESDLTAAELWARYRAATMFLCLSEHEGFCIPLLEAFHFGLPVIARDIAAVGEVVGDAGVLLDASDQVQTVAALLGLVAGDGELRAELVSRGRRRLKDFAYERTASTIRATLEAVAAR
jgi:glycosyltransferase involved in cell wall biosynthesis